MTSPPRGRSCTPPGGNVSFLHRSAHPRRRHADHRAHRPTGAPGMAPPSFPGCVAVVVRRSSMSTSSTFELSRRRATRAARPAAAHSARRSKAANGDGAAEPHRVRPRRSTRPPSTPSLPALPAMTTPSTIDGTKPGPRGIDLHLNGGHGRRRATAYARLRAGVGRPRSSRSLDDQQLPVAAPASGSSRAATPSRGCRSGIWTTASSSNPGGAATSSAARSPAAPAT